MNNGFDDGYTQLQRPGTSVKRYTFTRDVLTDMDTVEPSNVVYQRASRTAGKRMIQDELTRRPRPETYEDQAIDTAIATRWRGRPVSPAPLTPRPAATVKRGTRLTRRRLLIGVGSLLGAAVVGGAALSWAASLVTHYSQEMQEGAVAATELQLVCGHHDDQAHPTILHAFLQTTGTIDFIEEPGGDYTHAHILQTPNIRQALNYNGPLDQVYLQLIPEQLTNGKYQIRLQVQAGGVGIFSAPHTGDFLFGDSGQGHFVGIAGAGQEGK